MSSITPAFNPSLCNLRGCPLFSCDLLLSKTPRFCLASSRKHNSNFILPISALCYHTSTSSVLAFPSGCTVKVVRFFSFACFRFWNTSKASMEIVCMGGKLATGVQNDVAIKDFGRTHTYKQLYSYSLHYREMLQSFQNKSVEAESTHEGARETSILSGARVGIIAKPCVEFVAALWATWMCGGVAVPLAISHPEEELLHVMNDAEVSVVLGTEEYQECLEKLAKKCSADFFLLSLDAELSSNSSHSEVSEEDNKSTVNLYKQWFSDVENRGNDPALFIYTSGTTGKPKGVVHTHNGIGAQVKMLAKAWEYTVSDTFLHCLPLHHVHGLFNALLAPLYAGAAVDFMPKFSVRGIWQKFRDSYPMDSSKSQNAITVFTGVPTMYVRLLQGYEAMERDDQEAAATAARKLRLMMCGSSALPYPVMKQWENITGHRLLERYGMTEFGMALSNPLHETRKAGTVGKPLPGVQVKILGDNNDGELCVKSPSMFSSYWKKPQVTQDSFGDDGYFRTGDTVKIDDEGYYVILGRTNVDILKVGGYKLSALEIEATLLDHPKVSECAVLGLPDESYGELICAVIVATEEKSGTKASSIIHLQEIQNWAKDKLAPYKIPQKLHIWDSLPRNAMGKVNKKELKQMLLNE